MKQKIYSILLLLSFLVVLSHEMIPHHHHDFAVDKVSSLHRHSKEHFHYNDTDHHHHDTGYRHDHSDNEEHKHNFPLHFHVVAAKDYIAVGHVVNNHNNFNLKTLAVLFTFNPFGQIKEPPNIDFIRYTDISFLINSIFEPGAIGLRAPPSIACLTA